jgi:hypothetical protein
VRRAALVVVRLEVCKDRLQRVAHTFCTKRMVQKTKTAFSWYKTYGRPSARDPRTPQAEKPPRQPRTLSVMDFGCFMGIWARTLRVDRGMDGFRGPSGAHFVVCSLLVLGPKFPQNTKFCHPGVLGATETPETETLG